VIANLPLELLDLGAQRGGSDERNQRDDRHRDDEAEDDQAEEFQESAAL
jgi:hypothetical protein